MKILLLNPQVDAEHNIVRALEARDHGILLPMDAEEAWQILQLHGESVALAIIHREGLRDQDEGIQLISRLKASEKYVDLPIILTSNLWADAEFVEHQNGPEGVHAYLHWPFSGEQVSELIAQIFKSPSDLEPPVIQQGVGETSFSEVSLVQFSLDEQNLDLENAAETLSGDLPGESLDVSRLVLKTEREGDLDAPANLAAGFEQAEELFNSSMDGSGSVALDVSLPMEAGREPRAQEVPESQEAHDAQDAPEAQRVAPVLSDDSAAPLQESETPERREEEENRLASELPYLFGSGEKIPVSPPPALIFNEPVGDAVVPGGAVQSPDTETLKKYLLLREQDVGVLSTKLKIADERVFSLENAFKAERTRSGELERLIEEARIRAEGFEKEKAIALESLQAEVNELRFQNKAKGDKARLLEDQVREAADEIHRLKERVRSDIRKIRVREKELENKLELMRKDSEALILGRENKIIELKRKVDLLEFNMDLLQDQYSREKETSSHLRERLSKAAQVVRVASGMLESDVGSSLPGKNNKGEGSKAS